MKKISLSFIALICLTKASEKIILSCIALTVFILSGCTHKAEHTMAENKNTSVCSDECNEKNNSTELSCKLTSPELQKRRETVIAGLKSRVLEKKQLTNGYAFRFPGNDTMIDELSEFIKTERACCDFFTFNLSVRGDKSETWLELTGSDGVKEFITTELGL